MKTRVYALLRVCSNDSTHAAVTVPLAWLQLHNLKVKDRVQVSYDDEKVVVRPLNQTEEGQH